MARNRPQPIELPVFQFFANVGNAAFDGEGRGPEIVRLLRDAADRIEREGVPWGFQTLRDVNGNDVGRFGPARMTFAN
jgi:hypothetical protein